MDANELKEEVMVVDELETILVDPGKVFAGNYRKENHVDGEDFEAMKKNIQDLGQLQLGLVRLLPEPMETGEIYELCGGGRRLAAVAELGMMFEAKVYHGDADVIELQLSENIHRVSTTPIEEADALAALEINLNVGRDRPVTQEELAERVSRTQAWVSKKLALRTLPSALQAQVHVGAVAEHSAYRVASLPSSVRGRAMEEIRNNGDLIEPKRLSQRMNKWAAQAEAMEWVQCAEEESDSVLPELLLAEVFDEEGDLDPAHQHYVCLSDMVPEEERHTERPSSVSWERVARGLKLPVYRACPEGTSKKFRLVEKQKVKAGDSQRGKPFLAEKPSSLEAFQGRVKRRSATKEEEARRNRAGEMFAFLEDTEVEFEAEDMLKWLLIFMKHEIGEEGRIWWFERFKIDLENDDSLDQMVAGQKLTVIMALYVQRVPELTDGARDRIREFEAEYEVAIEFLK